MKAKEVSSSIPSRFRLSLTMIIVVMVFSSPVIFMANPVLAQTSTPPLPTTSTTPSAPSTIGQAGNDGDFTTQAALSVLRATQTNNLVNSKAYYDISFTTSAAGAIKKVEMDFPAGTFVGSANAIEVVGLGPGTLAASAGEVLTYTVTNAVNVPANTNIRIQMVNINNPTTPSASLTVTVTTRNAADAIIDGPTVTPFPYNIKQIATTDIANAAVTTSKIADGAITSTKPAESFMKKVTLFDFSSGHLRGWNPDGVATVFEISEPLASGADSSAIINVDSTTSADPVCSASQVFTSEIEVWCTFAPADGSTLDYTIINLPAHTF